VSPSASDDDIAPWNVVSSVTVIGVCDESTGASLTGETVMDTSPVSDNIPSDSVYSNDAVPAKFVFGVNVMDPDDSETTPLTGFDTAVTDSVFAGTSESESFDSNVDDSITTEVSSGVDTLSSTANGGLLISFTVTVIVSESNNIPSDTVTSNVAVV